MALRGSHSARIDEKGRLKVPADFRRIIESTWGGEVFLTTFTGQDALIFPLPVWEEFEARLTRLPITDPSRMRLQRYVNYFGSFAEMDAQGRVLLPTLLKERAGVQGEVVVLGYGNHLSVQSSERLVTAVEEPIEADLEKLSDLWRNQ